MDPSKRARLEQSWAHAYRNHALALIDEERFRRFFDQDNGRPNKPVRLVLSVLVLKEVHNLTDREALEQLEWNTAWHYALDVVPEEAHTCQKTLHNFRAMLLRDEEGAGVFESVTANLIEAAGLRTSRQRHDSTHVVSNMRLLTRLGLFVTTIEKFLEALRKEHVRLCRQVPEELRLRYLDREGYFSDARNSETPRRLEQAALDVYALVTQFSAHRTVAAMTQFGLLRRLYDEQCVPPDTHNPVAVELVAAPSSSSLQSPADPDVTYGHKGKGYEVQLTETCVTENPFQVVTAVSVNGANENDQHQILGALQQAGRTCGEIPAVVHTDGGYGSGANLVAAAELGTDLRAPVGVPPSTTYLPLDRFDFDEAGQRVLRCPAGLAPTEHTSARKGLAVLARFAAESCNRCPLATQCPAQPRGRFRSLEFAKTDIAVARRRSEQQTRAFKEQHKIRSGIEATNSELKRDHGLRKLRVRGRARVALAVRLKAVALNVKRYLQHLTTPAPDDAYRMVARAA